MRPGKLYIKIFLSFLLILVITEILIFALFIIQAGRSFHSRMDPYINAHVLIAKELAEDKIKLTPGVAISQNKDLRNTIRRLGQAYSSKVWLTDEGGRTLMKSFSGDIPKTLSDSRWRPVKDSADFELYRRRRGGWQWYGIIPVQIEAEDTGHLHLYFEKAERDHPEGLVPGLVIIGIVIALLVLPVSRYITKRIRGLAESASRITEGDLSHRATVKGKDEIGELGRAFNRMADKLEKMIQGGKELTANISHELRSPLARIRVAEELLREKCDATGEKELKRHLDSIQGDIEEMDRLIGQILDLSKMDLHDVPLNLEDMDPPAMIDELLEKLQPAIGLKAVRLTKEFSFNQPFVGDRKALRTAFSNVLDNAAKFVPEKGNLIVKVIPENDWLKISITNSSDPISPEDLERIFEPFYRQRETSKRGSGLGLAITKKIIERHGGSIRAVNSPEGLEIQILIPSADARE